MVAVMTTEEMQMTTVSEITRYCDQLLDARSFDDYCPNGLQVEASDEVTKIVSGVTASAELIDAAIEEQAQLLLVHHGYFWRGEPQPLIGMKGQRIAKLIKNGISLLAYHLPLDAHASLGNNVGLGKALGLEGSPIDAKSLIWMAESKLDLDQLTAKVQQATEREPLVIGENRPVKQVAWCTGAAQGQIHKAQAAGADVYISGEISESTVHTAREMGIAYIAAGHHATERFGARSLGEHLAGQFGLEHRFVDISNPV